MVSTDEVSEVWELSHDAASSVSLRLDGQVRLQENLENDGRMSRRSRNQITMGNEIMNDIFFTPYKGKDYESGGIFGKRIMILGESHYCDEGCMDCGIARLHPECADFTKKVVADYLNENAPRGGWKNTFLKFERSLVGHVTDWPERRRIWQSVMFYNYLQVSMGGPQQAGTQQQYEEAGKAFYKVIDKYRPEYIITWGRRLLGKLPDDDRWHAIGGIVAGEYGGGFGSYSLSGSGRSLILWVNHPSSGYSWEGWLGVIDKFLHQ